MQFTDVLALLGGLALFLYGMNVMGASLEKLAGSKLKTVLSSMTSNRVKGFFLGLIVTAVIQSSSATTVMVVGFVNSGLMTLRQAIGVIMGANIGTTVTAWILSLSGIGDGAGAVLALFKPSTFTPVLALIGIVFLMFSKSSKKKDIGLILLGFAVLMFGMDQMSAAVSGLKDEAWFGDLFLMFKNPILGVLAGALLTAIIQSSSASVGILQALSSTGAVTYGAAIPIIMGQNIGTCITALLSSFGTNRNAKRAAVVHLSFNVIGTIVWLSVYAIVNALFDIPFFDTPAGYVGISICHTVFNVACTILLLPMAGLLEKLAYRLIPEKKTTNEFELLDERLLTTPSIAIEQARRLTVTMAEVSVQSMKNAMTSLTDYTTELADGVRNDENKVDLYEDKLGSYLVKISALSLSDDDSAEVNKLLHIIGDFERISDHAVNIVESAEEMKSKEMAFSEQAMNELSSMVGAVEESLDMALIAFRDGDLSVAVRIEPLEQVVDVLKDCLKRLHIQRLTHGECTIELGFVLSDLITNLERVSDHCSNIAGCLIEMAQNSMDLHGYLRQLRDGKHVDYESNYQFYKDKYVTF